MSIPVERIKEMLTEFKRAKVEGVLNDIDQWDHGWNSALKLVIEKLESVVKEAEELQKFQDSLCNSPIMHIPVQVVNDAETHNSGNPPKPERDHQRQQAE